MEGSKEEMAGISSALATAFNTSLSTISMYQKRALSHAQLPHGTFKLIVSLGWNNLLKSYLQVRIGEQKHPGIKKKNEYLHSIRHDTTSIHKLS